MDDLLLNLDENGKLISANKLSVEFFGLTSKNFDTKTIFDYCHPDDKKSAIESFCNWDKTPHSSFTFESRQIGTSKKTRDIQWNCNVLQGEKLLITCHGKDITEQKQAERLETFTQFTINQVKTAIFWCNSDGTFFYVNPIACKWLGYSFDELMNMHVADINPEFPREAWKEHWLDIKSKGMVHMESHHQRRNGEKYPVELYSNYVQFEGEEYKLSFVNDITEKRKTDIELEKHRNQLEKLVREKTKKLDKAVKELQLTNKELNEKNKIISQQNVELENTLQNLKDTQTQLLQAEKMASLGILTAGVAHEINNPLNYIMGSYVGLEDFFDEEAPMYKERVALLLQSLKTGVDRASEIVQGLNQFSRDSKGFDEDCNVNNIIDNCLVMLQNQYKGRIDIVKNYYSANPLVKGNVGKLHQVFINILKNAVEAIKETGTIDISTVANHENVIVSIHDTGIGINQHEIDKLTIPFYTTKSPGEGTGLGLSITYNIIKEHNGEMEFYSENEKGTRVTVQFPIENKNEG